MRLRHAILLTVSLGVVAAGWFCLRDGGPTWHAERTAQGLSAAGGPADAPGGLPGPSTHARQETADPDASPPSEPPAEPHLSISGRVVDVDGRPIPDAWIGWLDGRLLEGEVSSDRHGRFRLRRSERAGSEVRLRCGHADFETLEAPGWYAWGRHDVQLVLQALVPLEVRVATADGALVPCKAVAVGDPRLDKLLRQVDGVWHGAVPRGRHEVRVELTAQARETLEVGRPEWIEVVGPAPVQHTVIVSPIAAVRVRVLGPAGKPIDGSSLQLVDLGGIARSGDLDLRERDFGLAQGVVCELTHAKSDDRGEAVLRGPAGRRLVVLALGPAHLPVAADVELPEPEWIELRPRLGARARGLVRPVEVLRQWLPGRPGIAFAHGAAWRPESGPERDAIAIGDDGTFEVKGMLPGSWRLALMDLQELWSLDPSMSSRAGSRQQDRVELLPQMVDLVDGDNPDIVIDLAELLTGELSARVECRGMPVAGRQVTVMCEEPGQVPGAGGWLRVITDPAGRFRLQLRAGRYGVRVWDQLPTGLLQQGNAGPSATVLAGCAVEHVFALPVGRCELTLIDGDGRPARGCAVAIAASAEDLEGWDQADGEGRVHADLHPGEWTVFGSDSAMWQAALRQPIKLRRQAVLASRVRLGTVTLRAGETTRAQFTVPDRALK